MLSHLGDTLRKPDGSTMKVSKALKDCTVLGLYFSAHWCPPCRAFTPELSKKYTVLKKANKDFELIFVSSDKDEAGFKEYHSSMSFPALPFAMRDAKAQLSKMFKVRGIPCLVFYDLKAQKVITTEGREEISASNFVEAFPYRVPEFSLGMLGKTLRKPGGGEVAASEALGKDVLGLYFSAHWCGPCQAFTPELSKKYTALKEAGRSIEIVFVSSDRNASAFASYHDSMSFLALPYEDRDAKATLSKVFEANSIPTLVFVDGKTGAVINKNGRACLATDSYLEDFPFHPKPMYDLSASTDGINDMVSLVVLMEEAKAEDQAVVSEALQALATEELAKPEGQRIASRFFTGKDGGRICERLRELCGYPAVKKGDDAVMLLLNFDDDGAHYHPLAEHKVPTAANMKAFLTAFKAGKLSRRTPNA